MSYHKIMPKLLPTGDVEIVLWDVTTGVGRYVVLGNGDALVLAAEIKALAKAGEKL